MKKYIGIQLNKEYFVSAFPRDYNVKYDVKTYNHSDDEIQGFVKSLSNNFTCVLENQGIYSAIIANYIYKAGFESCIVHPVQIERYALTKFFKEDYDSVIISKYGEEFNPSLYKPTPEFMQQIGKSWDVLRLLLHTRIGKRKKLHALENSYRAEKPETDRLRKSLQEDEKKIFKMEEELNGVVNKFINPYSL
ncbi:MAG: hypothetical protein AAF518_20980 [Spirochaetota bacterium]